MVDFNNPKVMLHDFGERALSQARDLENSN